MTIPFVPHYLDKPFSTGHGPILFPGEYFTDEQHRLLLHQDTFRQMYKTADFKAFTLVNGDWLSSEVSNSGQNAFGDAVVLSDGTFAIYQNDGTEKTTSVWTGNAADIDAGTVTRQGQVLDATQGGDCGVFYENSTDLVHIYTEDPANSYGTASSTRLLHHTTPANDLTTPTYIGVAIDTGGTWGTGDPDIFEFGGRYWMFTDYTESHPSYWSSLYSSANLTTWFAEAVPFTNIERRRGGDFDCMVLSDGRIIGFTEYDGPDRTEFYGPSLQGSGLWEFVPHVIRPARVATGTLPSRVSVGSSTMTIAVAVGPVA